jgi:hypothetical protein
MAASRMSASGQSRRVGYGPTTSGLPRLADILRVGRHVSKVPDSDMYPSYRREVHLALASGTIGKASSNAEP